MHLVIKKVRKRLAQIAGACDPHARRVASFDELGIQTCEFLQVLRVRHLANEVGASNNARQRIAWLIAGLPRHRKTRHFDALSDYVCVDNGVIGEALVDEHDAPGDVERLQERVG